MDYPRRRRLYLFLLNKLRLPRRLVTPLVKGLSFAADPAPYFQRRRAAGLARPPFAIPPEQGFRPLRAGELAGAEAMVAECRRLFEAARADGSLERKLAEVAKPFLVPVTANGRDLLARPAIRDFVLSPELTAVAAAYFGAVPILSEVELLWTPVNDTLQKSQKYHLDTEDYRQLKLFVNIFDVDRETGPFTLLPADVSTRVCAATGYAGGRRARLEDAAVERVAGTAAAQALGPAGSGIFVDTSRCLHYGSRGNRRERLVLLIQFMGYYAPKLEPNDWREVARPLLPGMGAAERLLLRC